MQVLCLTTVNQLKGETYIKLLTKEILTKLPNIYSTGDQEPEKIMVITKFFLPYGSASWYVCEFDPQERLCFGFANLGDDQMAELGYFSLDELEEIRHTAFPNLSIERDKFWDPKTSLADVMSFKIR